MAVRGVYLIHLDEPLGHARHYVGWSIDIYERVQAHMVCSGARMLAVAAERGLSFDAARIWPDAGMELERALKRGGNVMMHCPLCCDVYRARRREQMRRRRAVAVTAERTCANV